MMNEVLEKIGALRLIPVVKIENSKDAVPLGQALLEGRLPIAEITFRTAAAEGAIRALTAELPELLVGCGNCAVRRPGKISGGCRRPLYGCAGIQPHSGRLLP